MRKTYFFIGPYVECRSIEDITPLDSDEGTAWDNLLNDERRMTWNLQMGNSRIIEVDNVSLYQYCGMPIEKRADVPRFPMLFTFEDVFYNSENFDWSDIKPKIEIEWFKESYAEEIELLSEIFSLPLIFRWGGVYWQQ